MADLGNIDGLCYGRESIGLQFAPSSLAEDEKELAERHFTIVIFVNLLDHALQCHVGLGRAKSTKISTNKVTRHTPAAHQASPSCT